MFGLMTKRTHERLCNERFESLENVIDSKDETIVRVCNERDKAFTLRDDARRGFLNTQAKFNKALKDLAAQSDEIENLKARLNEAEADCAEWKGAALRNQADAEKFRAKAKADAVRKQAKRAAARNDAAPKVAKKGVGK
jgi:hypothetical protein